MAEEQGFEPWVGYKPTPVFKTGALNHSATPPNERDNSDLYCHCKLKFMLNRVNWLFQIQFLIKKRVSKQKQKTCG